MIKSYILIFLFFYVVSCNQLLHQLIQISHGQSPTSSTGDTHNAMHLEHPWKTEEDNKRIEYEKKKQKCTSELT